MSKLQRQRQSREASMTQQRANPATIVPAPAAAVLRHAPGAVVQRAMAAPHSLRPSEFLAMQRTLGNNAAGAMLGRTPLQAKLTINTPGDRWEREADRIAEEVMRMPEETVNRPPAPPVITATAISGSDRAVAADADFAHQLQTSRGRGWPMPLAVREAFEAKLGADFSSVRVHTDPEADQLSQAIQATAFTQGQDIYFAGGQYHRNNREGKRLLAHELTHVVQQRAADIHQAHLTQGRPAIGQADDKITIQREMNFKKADLGGYKEKQSGIGKGFTAYSDLAKALEEYEAASDVRGKLLSLQKIEAIANEWLAKRGPESGRWAEFLEEWEKKRTPSVDVRRQKIPRTADKESKIRTLLTQVRGELKNLEGIEQGLYNSKIRGISSELYDKGDPDETTFLYLTMAAIRAHGSDKIASEGKTREELTQQYNISSEEISAIRFYTEGDYRYITPILGEDEKRLDEGITTLAGSVTEGFFSQKAGAISKLDDPFSRRNQKRRLRMEAMQHVRKASSGLAKLPLVQNTTVYRGMVLPEAELRKYQQGGAIKWPAFTSTTTVRDVAEDWILDKQQAGKKLVIFIIDINEGRDIHELSAHPSEGEVLLPNKSKFTVNEGPSKVMLVGNQNKQAAEGYTVRLTQQNEAAAPPTATPPPTLAPPPTTMPDTATQAPTLPPTIPVPSLTTASLIPLTTTTTNVPTPGGNFLTRFLREVFFAKDEDKSAKHYLGRR
jgi:hypothetical protein